MIAGLMAVVLIGPALVGHPGLGAAEVGPAATPTHKVLAGDFTGDGHDDLLFFGVGTAPDQLWDFQPDSFVGCPAEPVVRPITINSVATPVVGDFTGDDVDDIFWYAPGAATDRLWEFNASSTVSYTGQTVSVGGTSYRPVTGDLSNDGVDDIVWYAPGTAPDSIWDFNLGGTRTIRAMSVSGTYRPLVGRFSEDPQEDIFWYGPGSTKESIWGYVDGSFVPVKFTDPVIQVTGTYQTAVTDSWGDGQDDIVFANPGPSADHLWDFYQFDLFKEPLPLTDTAEPTADGAFTEIVGAAIHPPAFTPVGPFGDLFAYDGVGLSGELLDFDRPLDERTLSRCAYSPAPQP